MYYGTAFAVIGTSMPFWPLWLQSRSLSPVEIGLIMALSVTTKTISNPLVAAFADRYGERKRIMVFLTLFATCIFSTFYWANSFWSLIAVTLLFHAFWSPNMPLMESLTMQNVRSKSLDYGRIRLWGSLAFIIGTWGMGQLLARHPIDFVYWITLALLALTFFSTLILPDNRIARSISSNSPIRIVLKDRTFIVLIVATALIQSSHAVYYSFSAIHWKSVGHSEEIIGWLWAEGVLAEIFLFMWGTKFIKRYGAVRVTTLAGIAGLIRWGIVGSTHTIEALLITQLLHAFTFGAAHLGAIHFISQRMIPSVSATAQTVYSIIVGLTMGVSTWSAGLLYADLSSQSYLLMAVMAGGGGFLGSTLKKKH